MKSRALIQSPTSYFSTESPRKRTVVPEKEPKRYTWHQYTSSPEKRASQLFSRKSTNDRSRNGRNHLRSWPPRLNPHRIRLAPPAFIKTKEGFRGYFWENFGNLFAKQRLAGASYCRMAIVIDFEGMVAWWKKGFEGTF